MATAVSAARVAALVGSFDRSPAYVGLADTLTLLIGDGRIGFDVRLPSERELTEALAVSRTTVTRAYALLRESGYAVSQQGSGTFTRACTGSISPSHGTCRRRETATVARQIQGSTQSPSYLHCSQPTEAA